jgi:hypothetical protein
MQRYTALKDSILNSQFMFRLTNYKEQAEFKKQLGAGGFARQGQ